MLLLLLSRFSHVQLCVGQEATVRILQGTTDWFKIGKGVQQGCIYHLAYLTYM